MIMSYHLQAGERFAYSVTYSKRSCVDPGMRYMLCRIYVQAPKGNKKRFGRTPYVFCGILGYVKTGRADSIMRGTKTLAQGEVDRLNAKGYADGWTKDRRTV
jgi:hypothetical protein